MRKTVKKYLVLLLTFALVFSTIKSDQLSVRAEEVQEETGIQTTAEEEPDVEVSKEEEIEKDAEVSAPSEETDDGQPSSEESGAPSEEESSEAVTAEETGEASAEMTDTEETEETESKTEIDTETGVETETETESETETETESETETETESETETETESEEDTVLYMPEFQPEGITVKAYATKGVLPEGAVLKVSRMQDDGKIKDVRKALDESDVSYDGMLTLDISFFDGDDKIEPEDGTVKVELEIDADFLEEDVEEDSLKIQHLEEKGDDIKVNTVADAGDETDGSIKVRNAIVKAEFEVESFSVFAITWGIKEIQKDNSLVNFQRSNQNDFQVKITKEWKNEKGEELKEVPFDRVTLVVEQYYQIPTTEGIKEETINSSKVFLTKEGSWETYYPDQVKSYSYFRVLDEIYGPDDNDWKMEWQFTRGDISGVIANDIIKTTPASVHEVTVPGDSIIVIKSAKDEFAPGKKYFVWYRYANLISDSEKSNLMQVLSNEIKGNFSEDNCIFSNELRTNIDIQLREKGDDIEVTFGATKEWALFWSLQPVYSSTTSNLTVANIWDTSKKADYKITKMWDDDNDVSQKRPDHIIINAYNKLDTDKKNPTTVKLTVQEALDDNTWQQIVKLPKYNSDGTIAQYYIEEVVPEGYMPSYSETGLEVINRLKQSKFFVRKIIDGNMADLNQEFAFTLTLTTKDGKPFTEELENQETNGVTITNNHNGTYTFHLKGGQSLEVELPFGCSYEVTEDKLDYTQSISILKGEGEYNSDDGIVSGKLDEETDITFTNTKELVVPPTGIHTDTAPYLVMVLTAFVAGLWFFLRHRKKALYSRRDFR